MPKFVVEGGYPIGGRVRPAGNKNAALPMIAAAVLTDQEVVLENVPDIKDVRTLLELLRSMGAEADFVEAGVVRIRAGGVDPDTMNPALASRIRGSILLAGPMLARHGSMRLPPPGGDVIGRRRVDTHILALRRLGMQGGAGGGADGFEGVGKKTREGREWRRHINRTARALSY
jgi:UDP-N-acetylglucosamine 1-carboxyvinyltransferase